MGATPKGSSVVQDGVGAAAFGETETEVAGCVPALPALPALPAGHRAFTLYAEIYALRLHQPG